MPRKLLGLLALCLFVTGCNPSEYTIEPIEAWAVDAETGEPIEGANVVAIWALYHQSWHGSYFREMPEVKEAVTDNNGRFSFPGFTLSNAERHRLDEDPKVIIFKSGYQYVRRNNGCSMRSDGNCRGATRIAQVAGTRVKMKRLDHSVARKNDEPQGMHQRSLYFGLSTEMGNVESSGNRKKIPQFYEAIRTEDVRLSAKGFYGRNGLP